MKRGDLVTVVIKGAYGKPRPALIIQSDLFSDIPSITILPVTSKIRDVHIFRILLKPTDDNGLKKNSQVMVDKVQTVPREQIGQRIGKIDKSSMLLTERALTIFLGIA